VVRYLVVGAIARTRGLVRTNVRLVDAATGTQLWGDRFENEFADLPRLENASTGPIAASLNHQLVRAEGRRVETSIRRDALDLRLQATSLFFGSIVPENTLTARQLLRRSLSLDPSQRKPGRGSPSSRSSTTASSVALAKSIIRQSNHSPVRLTSS